MKLKPLHIALAVLLLAALALALASCGTKEAALGTASLGSAQADTLTVFVEITQADETYKVLGCTYRVLLWRGDEHVYSVEKTVSEPLSLDDAYRTELTVTEAEAGVPLSEITRATVAILSVDKEDYTIEEIGAARAWGAFILILGAIAAVFFTVVSVAALIDMTCEIYMIFLGIAAWAVALVGCIMTGGYTSITHYPLWAVLFFALSVGAVALFFVSYVRERDAAAIIASFAILFATVSLVGVLGFAWLFFAMLAISAALVAASALSLLRRDKNVNNK